jgi:RNA polymerase sigma-70 factor (ECF subfamily)
MALPYFFAHFPDDLSPPVSGEHGNHAPTPDIASRDVPDAERDRIALIRAGDAVAYDALFVELYAPLREFCVTYVRTVAIAEEIVQDVFLDLWVRRETWWPVGGVRAYLFRAVRNRAVNAVRNARTATRLGTGVVEEWMGGPPPLPDAESPGAALVAALAPVIASLPPARRRAALLRWHFGMSYAEIAEVMQTSVASVTKHIARAREDVRPVVERYLKE